MCGRTRQLWQHTDARARLRRTDPLGPKKKQPQPLLRHLSVTLPPLALEPPLVLGMVRMELLLLLLLVPAQGCGRRGKGHQPQPLQVGNLPTPESGPGRAVS